MMTSDHGSQGMRLLDWVAWPTLFVFFTGKGGVGKTTIATRLALALAGRGQQVHLSTTDPAGPLTQLADAPDGLTVSRIDPQAETAKYVTTRLAAARDLDPHRRALLEVELRSPCTTELAVFRALSRLLIVTLAETTPVAEAAELQDDLRRAGIEPFGWVINATLAASGTRDPVLTRRASLEAPHLHRVTSGLASRAWLAPWEPTQSRQALASAAPGTGRTS